MRRSFWLTHPYGYRYDNFKCYFLIIFFFTFKRLQHDIWYTRNCLQKSLPLQYYPSKRLPIHKQPFRDVLSKRCSENIHQIYKRIPIPKCDFDKVGKQPYWNHTSALVFSYKLAAYFQNTFYQEHLWMAAFAHTKIWPTMKTTERRHWHCSSIFILNLKQFSPLAFVLQLLTLNR